MKPLKLCIGFAIAACFANAACAGSVIANASLALSADDVQKIYKGDMQIKGGVSLDPIDNPTDQSNFLARLMQTDVSQYQARWTKKSFREGLNPPRIAGSDAEVIEFIKKSPGGVGYISGSAPAGVKLVTTY